MRHSWDAVVVGARCAGSPTAMLLARQGLKVLLVDRANFPSDTVSTHLLHPVAVAALKRWGIAERLAATGCPPITSYAWDFGRFKLSGAPGTADSPVAYCARRTVLDKLLVDAAAEAGAVVREGFTVDGVIVEDGRVAGIRGHSRDDGAVEERARLVVAADGRYSPIAEAVGAERYDEKPPLLATYYAYWSGFDAGDRYETFVRKRRGFSVLPTHAGLTMAVAAWPYAEFEENKKDLEGHYLRTLELIPAIAERLRAAKRETRISGAAVPNFFRKPWGPGWALVGDAGYSKDPVTAQGIQDAFRDAESLAAAIHDALGGARPFDAAMADYQRLRDEHVRAMYEWTCQLASFEPLPKDRMERMAASAGDSAAMDAFARINAGTDSPETFFRPEGARLRSASPSTTTT